MNTSFVWISAILDKSWGIYHLKGMKASEADILFIPGYGNSGPDHWQTRWQSKLASARRVEQAAWHEPVRDDWVASIEKAILAAQKPVVLVAHSLGVGAALQALPACKDKVAGGFFVSPLNLVAPSQLPVGLGLDRLNSFGPYPTAPLPFPSITIASRDDPHGTYEHAGDIANAWGSFLVDAGNSGHINVDSGHGPWPEGTMVFAQFLSRLKAPSAPEGA
jgi:predicted alpha/beta hydrolase family esterase